MSVFDLWDQASITEMVRVATDRILGDRERIAGNFAPITPTMLEKIGRGQIKLKSVGKGDGIVADDATPPIFRPELRYAQEAWGLMRLTEMTPVEESLRRKLQMNGTDPESQAERDLAGVDIITRARAIAVRQENLSDYLVMQAVINGELEIQAVNPPGQDPRTRIAIDYEYPVGAITQAPTTFTNVAVAKPVDVLRAMQEQVKKTCGRYGSDFWLSSEVMNYILAATDTIARFQFNTTVTMNPQVTEQMLASLLHAPGNNQVVAPESSASPMRGITFHVTDAGWFDLAAGYGTAPFGEDYLDEDKTRWIPADRVICMAPSPSGDPFAQMYDGMVAVQTDWNKLTYKGPGAQTYEQLVPGNLTMFYRWEARRFPMIHHPERIAVAKVIF